MTWRPIRASAAFMMVAFSRSRKPMRPIALRSSRRRPGASSATIRAARSSMERLIGANTHEMATASTRLRRIWRAATADRAFVERRVLAAVELVAARKLETRCADASLDVVRPSAHRWQRLAGGPGKPQDRDFEQTLALDERIGKMRRPDHHAVDGGCFFACGGQYGTGRCDDATAHVRGRRALGRRHDRAARDEDRVRIGAPHVDAQTHARSVLAGAGSQTAITGKEASTVGSSRGRGG